MRLNWPVWDSLEDFLFSLEHCIGGGERGASNQLIVSDHFSHLSRTLKKQVRIHVSARLVVIATHLAHVRSYSTHQKQVRKYVHTIAACRIVFARRPTGRPTDRPTKNCFAYLFSM